MVVVVETRGRLLGEDEVQGAMTISHGNYRYQDLVPVSASNDEKFNAPGIEVPENGSFSIDFYPCGYLVNRAHFRVDNVNVPESKQIFFTWKNEDLEEVAYASTVTIPPGNWAYYEIRAWVSHDWPSGGVDGIDRPGAWSLAIRNDDPNFWNFVTFLHTQRTTRQERNVRVKVKNRGTLRAQFRVTHYLENDWVNEVYDVEDNLAWLDPGDERTFTHSFLPNVSGDFRWTSRIYEEGHTVQLDDMQVAWRIGY